MAVALIVAAGRGERLGSDRPKALVPLAGRPMLAWSVDALRAVPAVREIVVALPPEWQHAAPEGTIAVTGGEQRSHSVRAALRASSGEDPVIVHDAARPLVTPELFIAALDELEASGAQAAIAAAPVTDTIKQTGGHQDSGDPRTVTGTLDRSRLWAIQTPQVFRRAALRAALDGPDELLARATDDAWLIEQAGGTVRIVPSGPGNFKVTTPEDLRVAALLMADRGVAAEPAA
jgi:2-C-methyl-D-erythritol 4-phosphate cytidylyltransferase